jgi:hypothetical protein
MSLSTKISTRDTVSKGGLDVGRFIGISGI